MLMALLFGTNQPQASKYLIVCRGPKYDRPSDCCFLFYGKEFRFINFFASLDSSGFDLSRDKEYIF